MQLVKYGIDQNTWLSWCMAQNMKNIWYGQMCKLKLPFSVCEVFKSDTWVWCGSGGGSTALSGVECVLIGLHFRENIWQCAIKILEYACCWWKQFYFTVKKNIVINVQRLIQKMLSSITYNDPGRCLMQTSDLHTCTQTHIRVHAQS